MDPLEKFKTDFARLRSEAHQPKTAKADDKPKRRTNGAAAAAAQNGLREFGDPLPGDGLDDDVPFGEQVAQKTGTRTADSATALDVYDAGDEYRVAAAARLAVRQSVLPGLFIFAVCTRRGRQDRSADRATAIARHGPQVNRTTRVCAQPRVAAVV